MKNSLTVSTYESINIAMNIKVRSGRDSVILRAALPNSRGGVGQTQEEFAESIGVSPSTVKANEKREWVTPGYCLRCLDYQEKLRKELKSP